ncbi:RNA polymerase sigma factor SigM [soil metagenome]
MLRRGKGGAEARPVRYDRDRLAVEAARRDPHAFEALYRKYVAQVYSFALYELRNPHAAEDLTAQVFLRALTGLPGFREQGAGEESSFRVWLFQICRNSISNERRRQRRHPEAPLDTVLDYAAPDDVSERVADRQELARALAAIHALPAERRRALVLRFVHEMTAREIGQVLGKSESAVRVTIHRALRQVTEQLRQPRGPAH